MDKDRELLRYKGVTHVRDKHSPSFSMCGVSLPLGTLGELDGALAISEDDNASLGYGVCGGCLDMLADYDY